MVVDMTHSSADAENKHDSSEGGTPLKPSSRPLRVFAFDPGAQLDLETNRVNHAVVKVVWEDCLLPGPVGDYVEVVDFDPASKRIYPPVDLNHRHLLADAGLAPSEGDPFFHQQMVYAVVMKTIAYFEEALGRFVHWSTRREFDPASRTWRHDYVPRLRIYPHAMREANAYYSPDKKALLFGYFNGVNENPADGLPGGMVFTCLSHDVIVHETTHAILDGIHRRLIEASNDDSLAFHEGFSDIVALLQHFTLPGVLESQISITRGDLERESLLTKVAVEFGQAIGRRQELRNALGELDPKSGQWKRRKPDPSLIKTRFEPHDRGAIFVSAVFDAFVALYRMQTADLVRLATNGTGVLPAGNIHPDLVARLSLEARRLARRLLQMFVRAVDYLPPVDVTFGDYLRGLVTADVDAVPEDAKNYRIAIVRAFRDWGIYPRDVRTLSIESLRWLTPNDSVQALLVALLPPHDVLQRMAFAGEFALSVEEARQFTGWKKRHKDEDKCDPSSHTIAEKRFREFLVERHFREYLHEHLRLTADRLIAAESSEVDRKRKREAIIAALGIDLCNEDLPFEIHAVRPALRVRSRGRSSFDLLILITQRRRQTLQPERAGSQPLEYYFRAGCTLLIDPTQGRVRYSVIKKIDSKDRRRRQEAFLRGRLRREGPGAAARFGLWETEKGGLRSRQEPFRMLHADGSEDEA